MSYLPQVGAVWLELVSPGVNLTCQESKERAREGEVKSWERQSKGSQRKSGGDEKRRHTYVHSHAHPLHSLHCVRSPSLLYYSRQCDHSCGSEGCQSVCKLFVTSSY